MKQFLRKTMFALVGSMMFGAPAMADTTIVGPEDNLNNGYYAGEHKKNYTLEPGKTIKIEFTVSTATDEQLGGDVWNPWYAWAVNFWDGTLNAITIEPRNYGWEDKTDNNRWTENWAKYWAINYPENWESGYNFRDNMIQGATVVTTIKRVGADVIIIYDITTTSNAKYRQYAVKTYGDGTQTIWFDLIVNHTHITIDNDKTVTTDTESATGTLIGNLNRCAGFTTPEAKREDFVIAPEGTLNLKFRNYTAGFFTWQSWMFEMLYNGKYCNMVAGNRNQWGELKSANGIFTNTNWPATDAEILEKMEGALVDLTIQRSGANVTVTAVHTPVSGDPFTLKYEFSSNEAGFATSDAEFHLISDYGYLDLLPVTTTVSAYGWSTFSSDYALDFAKATEGLEAYMITGHEGNVVKLAKVTGTVPAGTGLLLKGTAGAEYNIPIVGSSDTDVSANLLKAGTGAAVSAESGKTTYVLSVNSGNAEFQKITTTPATVAKGKAYLVFNETISAPAMLFEGDITGISAIESAGIAEDGIYYNLSGQRVAQPTKGLYIVNGKKVIVKK